MSPKFSVRESSGFAHYHRGKMYFFSKLNAIDFIRCKSLNAVAVALPKLGLNLFLESVIFVSVNISHVFFVVCTSLKSYTCPQMVDRHAAALFRTGCRTESTLKLNRTIC